MIERITSISIIIIQKMKPNKFKIRVFQPHLKSHPPNFDSELSEDGLYRDIKNEGSGSGNEDLNNIFRHILISLQKLNSSILTKRQDLEVRDRSYLLDLPAGSSYKKRRQVIRKWVDKMVNDVVSIAFNYYSNDQLTYQQTKVFSSENILSNIAALVDQYDLNAQQLKELDQFIRDDVLQLLLKKYPMTESIVVNRRLEAVAKAPDLSDKIQNDFFTINPLKFEPKADYSKQIKQMINTIIKVANDKSSVVGKWSNFETFKRCMGKIFEMVQDMDWMQSTQDERNNKLKGFVDQMGSNDMMMNSAKGQQAVNLQNETQKTQYKQKVKSYTSYLIGRKVSENTAPFSQEEIQAKGLQVKSTAILRILTKWCEQLWQKFIPKNYYMNRSQDFMLQGGQVKALSAQMRSRLDKLMQQQKTQIRTFMSKLTNDNYEAQVNLLNQLLENSQDEFRQKSLERVSEKFSVLIGKSLQKWALKYLNRLIQGLVNVAHNFHNKYMMDDWPSPPNLVTFKIGDLMRCKCSSGEQEILYIFKQIKWLSDNKPQVLSVTRIKNRLSLGTNDILMNIKFGGSTICQIQLAVNSNKSKFLKASNGMSHYLYELQRSLFGPINQLGSIWRSLDLRASYFDKKGSGGSNTGSHRCQLLKKSFEFQPFEGAFICSLCKSTYSENKLLVKHAKCSECSFWKCAYCQIKLATSQNLATMFVSDVILRKMCQKKVEINEENKDLPEFGVAIRLNSQKYSPVVVFKKVQVRGISYLFSKQEGNISLIAKLSQEGAEQKFTKENIVFELNSEDGSSLIDLTVAETTEKYFLPQYISQCYSQHKTSITLQNQPLTQQNCMSVFEGKKSDQLAITALSLVNTQIKSIWPLDQLFPNIQQLSLTRNTLLASFQTLFYFFKMKKFAMKEMTLLQTIPKEISLLKALTHLHLQDCLFQEIPTCIGDLKQLRVLSIYQSQGDKNWQRRIRQVPVQLYTLSALQELNLSFQAIKEIHQDIGRLTNLKSLNLRNNQFNYLPETINSLTSLESLDFRENPIKELPKSMRGLANLKNFRLQKIGEYSMKLFGEEMHKNHFSSLPQDLELVGELKIIDVHSQNLKELPSLEKCRYLEQLNLFRCSIVTGPRLRNCLSLKRLILKQQMSSLQSQRLVQIDPNLFQQTPNLFYFCASFNYLKAIPESIRYLTQLQELDLHQNQIEEVCQEIGSCTNIVTLNLSQNKVRKLPNSLSNLHKLEYLFLFSNEVGELNDSLSECSALRQLYLNGNRIRQFKDCMGKLNKLEVLALQSNLIETLPKSLNNCKKMTQGKFVFHGNPLYIIQCWDLVKKADFRSISMSNHIKNGAFQTSFSSVKLQRFSEKIGKATHLKSISVKGQQLSELPDEISALSSLQTISLKQNIFELFPIALTGCLNLRQLNMENNRLAEIPNQIGKLINLQILDLSVNKLSSINPAINQCTALKTLILNQNQITHIDNELFATLQHLELITIIACGLNNFPKGLLQCSALQKINLGVNKISTLNCHFDSTCNIKVLNIFQNQFTQFPEQLLECESLQEIYLDKNQITSIPENIHRLRNLAIISMNFNKIREIPRTIGLVKSLRELNLPNNEIEVLVRQLSELTCTFNVYRNPVKRVECRHWIMQHGTEETKKIAKALAE